MRKLIAAVLAAALLTPVAGAPALAKGKHHYEKHERYDKRDRHRYSYRDRHRDRYRDRHDYRDRHHYDRRDRYERRHRYDRYDRYARNYRTWRRGDRFDRGYARYYRVVDYRDYRRRLYAPPRGYRWVRSDGDALLIGITSGIVSAIVSNAFHRY